MKRFRVLLLLLLLGLPALLAAGLAALDTPWADAYLARHLPLWAQGVGYQLSLDSLDLEPWAARLTLGGIDLQQGPTAGSAGWQLAVRRATVRLRVLPSLLGTPHLELTLDTPQLRGELPAFGGAGGAAGGGGGGPRVVLRTLQLTDGSIQLRDPGRGLDLAVESVQVGWVHDVGGGTARGVRLGWNGGEQSLDRVEFVGSRRFATLVLDRLDLEGPRLRLHTKGRLGPWRLLGLEVEGAVQLEGWPAPWLQSLHLTRFIPLGGALLVDGHLGGSTHSPHFDGVVELHGGRFGAVHDADFHAEGILDGDGLRLRQLHGASNVAAVEALSGRLRWDDGVRLEARGKVRGYRLRPFMQILFPDTYFPVGLSADVEFQADGPLYPELAFQARGEATVAELDVTTGPEGQRHTRFTLPAARLRTQLTVGRREMTFGPSRLETESVDVDVSGGRIVYREGLWFSTVAEIRSLALARPLLPPWLEAWGRAAGKFGGPYRELKFAYDLDLPEVSLRGQSLGRLAGHGEFDLRDLQVTQGHLTGPLGKIYADGMVTLRPDGEHNWQVRWEDGDLAATAAYLRGLGVPMPLALAGAVSSQGRLTGPLTAPRYAGTAELTQVRVERFQVARAALTGQASRSGWQVPRAELDAYGARAAGSGAGGAKEFHAALDVTGLDVASFLEQIGTPLPVDGQFAGQVQARGRYPAAQVSVAGQVSSPQAYGHPLPDSELELTLDRSTLKLSASALAGRLAAQIQRSFVDGALEARATARGVPWADLPEVLLPAGLAGTSVSGSAVLQAGPATPLGAHWQGAAAGLAWQQLALGDVPFQGDYTAGSVGFHASAWDGSVQVDGLTSPEPGAPVELELTLRQFALRHLVPYLSVTSGLADGRGRALLGREQWQSARGLGRFAALAELELDATVVEFGASRGLTLPPLRAHITSPAGRPRWVVATQGLELTGEVEDLDRATWRTEARLERFAPWPLLPAGAGGERGGYVTGAGSVQGVGGRVESALGNGRLEELHWGVFGPSRWDWEGAYRDAQFTATLEEPRGVTVMAAWQPATGLRADLALREVPLDGWVSPPVPALELTGLVEGHGALTWAPEGQPQADLELTELVLRRPPATLAAAAPVRLHWDGTTVQVEPSVLKGQGLEVAVSGTVEPLRTWKLETRGAVDLATLAAWVPAVERGTGQARWRLAVRGPWREPQVQGPLEIPPGAALKLVGVPVALEDLELSGALEAGRRFTLDWLDAQVRDGRLHLEGSLDLDHWRPGPLRFYGEIRDLDLQWPPQVVYRFDADVLATGTVAAPQVRGEVRLQEFLYSRNINWRRLVLDALDRKPRQVQARTEGGVFVDLAVRGRDDVRVENNVAELDLAADLRVRGYLPAPTLWGRVDVLGGTARFLGRDYAPQQSTVEFLGETQPAPQLDLHAQTRTRDYTVNVDVTGPLDNYQVGLSSVPYLSHTDIAALLALGRTSQDLRDPGGGVTGVEAASLLSEGLQDQFDAVGGFFGVDQFHIDPSYSPATQTTVPRVTIGKAITEELRARYSAAMGADTQQNVELEYSLSPRVSLLGTWVDRDTQQRGSLGGEVRFRFPFR